MPLSAGEIESYVNSARGHEPIPQWLNDILHILVEEGDAKFKPLKISESVICDGLGCR